MVMSARIHLRTEYQLLIMALLLLPLLYLMFYPRASHFHRVPVQRFVFGFLVIPANTINSLLILEEALRRPHLSQAAHKHCFLLRRRLQKGFTILEVVFATGIALLLLTTLIVGSVFSLNNVTFARNQAQATKLAQEEMERLRAVRDMKGYSSLSCSSPTSCTIDASLTISSVTTQETVGIFKRYFTIDSLNNNCQVNSIYGKYVTVTVQWNQGLGAASHQTKLTSCITDWLPL